MSARKNILIFIAAVIVLISVSLVVSRGTQRYRWEFPQDWYSHDTDTDRAEHDPLLGKPMPALQLTDWHNGEVTRDDLRGKVVVIDFWSTTCAPCLALIPEQNKFWADYRDRGVALIGVCTGEGQQNLVPAISRFGISYPVALDPGMKTGLAWHILWFPTYAVIDRKGTLRAMGVKPAYVRDVVEALLKEPTETPSGAVLSPRLPNK